MLQTILMTAFFPLLCVAFAVFQSQKGSKADFFSKDYTTVLKGICCIVVILIHVPAVHGNGIQRLIGCFAYVCVTIFFMISAYGMMKSNEKGNGYLKSFWRNRLVSLFIPCVFVNCTSLVLGYIDKGVFSYHALLYLNDYVKVLLEWCIWFYIVELLKAKFFPNKPVLEDALLIGGVVISSLLYYFCVDAQYSAQAGWCFERMGLVWGVLLCRNYDRMLSWMTSNRVYKEIFFLGLSLLLGVAYLHFKWIPFWGAYLLKINLGVVIIITLFLISMNRRFGGKASLFFGKISYEVYLLHGVILLFLASLLPESINSGLFIFATILLTLLLAFLINKLDKPVVAFLRKK